jgi:hypothetical protein
MKYPSIPHEIRSFLAPCKLSEIFPVYLFHDAT